METKDLEEIVIIGRMKTIEPTDVGTDQFIPLAVAEDSATAQAMLALAPPNPNYATRVRNFKPRHSINELQRLREELNNSKERIVELQTRIDQMKDDLLEVS